ncbi:hypothetical protein HWX16_23245 [Ochrobactrum intermedium]|uniref:hypothetical protein n=1 Tax=Brucella intermedia TaxID=94625 RepID=UPI00159C8AB3|nr:hypothetical protein [Brucella intermedia]NVM43203.1 hypothetical protein [Brucella intermedia]
MVSALHNLGQVDHAGRCRTSLLTFFDKATGKVRYALVIFALAHCMLADAVTILFAMNGHDRPHSMSANATPIAIATNETQIDRMKRGLVAGTESNRRSSSTVTGKLAD